MAGTELGEPCSVWPRKSDFFLVDVRRLLVQDPVMMPGPDSGVHILSVQYSPEDVSLYSSFIYGQDCALL